jgi:site-specific recombinase XerD
MANLANKDGVYLARFRYRGREYKKSLKTRDAAAAKAGINIVELTIHRLLTGQLQIPADVDPAGFIVSGGTWTPPRKAAEPPPAAPSMLAAVASYLASRENKSADSYIESQRTHLRHLTRHLGARADKACTEISLQDLEQFIQARLKIRDTNTVARERNTLRQFFRWLETQKEIVSSPADELEPLKSEVDLPEFKTIREVEEMLQRGGLTDREQHEIWDSLYLKPEEISGLLQTVRQNATRDVAYLLHAIPAYCGLRRGELLGLRWGDVNFDQRCITARSRKQSRSKKITLRRIDMNTELCRELLAWREQRPRGQFVICDRTTLEPLNPDRANRDFWQPMRGTEWCLDRKKNWYRVGYHTYRHSFASNLAAKGVDQRYIDRWMGQRCRLFGL